MDCEEALKLLKGGFEGIRRWNDWQSDNDNHVSIRRPDLSRVDLCGADLGKANLRRAILSGADLSRANLGFADLSVADLTEANLSEADLSLANLGVANLRGYPVIRKFRNLRL
ncbi:pentapeptide repeat-containing protein [Singulisphaera rosea]